MNPQFNWGFKKLKAMGRKNNLQSYNKVKVCQPNNKKQRRYRHEKRQYKLFSTFEVELQVPCGTCSETSKKSVLWNTTTGDRSNLKAIL